MKPIAPDEVLPFADYERVRSRLRPLFIREKDRRRLAVGGHMTLLFENGQTVWYQIEEMLRSEKISSAEAVKQEIDTYNELLPAPGGLSATLMIEYADPAERDAALRKLIGLERHLWMVLGERRVGARFDDRQMSAERVSSVQFVQFAPLGIGPDELVDLARRGQLSVEVDHPVVQVRAPVSEALATALAEDLRD